MENAAEACSFASRPGSYVAPEAAAACDVLRAAGIPSSIVTEEDSSEKLFRVMVPAPLILNASSVLDKEIFNVQLESNWRTLLNALSDEELRALSPDAMCAGFADRIARLKAAYRDEIARRRL